MIHLCLEVNISDNDWSERACIYLVELIFINLETACAPKEEAVYIHQIEKIADDIHNKTPHVVTVLWLDSDDVVTILSSTRNLAEGYTTMYLCHIDSYTVTVCTTCS